MVVILEGPDRCGKTTLAERLRPDVVFHCGAPGTDARLEYETLSLKIRTTSGLVVVDRFFYGELVYGPLLRRRSQLTWDDVAKLEDGFQGTDVKVVWCLPDIAVVLRQLNGVDEPFVWKVDNVRRVYQDYLEVMYSCRLPMITYDFTVNPTADKVLQGFVR